jgi:hypothetical protein
VAGGDEVVCERERAGVIGDEHAFVIFAGGDLTS